MQYNTALCFVALGVGAWLLVARRGPRALPALCGTAVACMGLLVLAQYATGVNLGVDTLFFSPWESALTPAPGRMALTSALSFTLSGASLALLALRPQALAASAVANTLPLSFGLTSLLGYLLRVTYVLPFNLGSQMAVHTAACFVAYGYVMLWHAWSRSSQSQGGLPAWGPAATATAIVPVVFVAVSSVIDEGTTAAVAWQLLISVGCAAALGFAIHRLRDAMILHKGFLLVSTPLVFLLAFVGLATEIKKASESAAAWSRHSQQVIAQAESLSGTLYEAESSMRGVVISRAPEFSQRYYRASRDVPAAAARLTELVRDNPEQSARARLLSEHASRELSFLAGGEQLLGGGGGGEEFVRDVKAAKGEHLMGAFRREMELFMDEEVRLGRERNLKVEEAWQRFNWLLVAGAAAAIILALMLALMFGRGIVGRLLVLTSNAQALADGREMAGALSGSDEIARLDRVFHEMAAALAEAAARDRRLNEQLAAHAAQLEAANKELEAFSYSVSHDLRAPLRAIDGFSRIIEEDYSEAFDDEGRRLLGVVRRNTQKMGALIDDLLAFSRLGRKELTRTRIDMAGMARSTFDELGPQAQAATLRVPELPPAYGDPAMVRQVFANLLSNALKFAGKDGGAVVEVGGRNGGGENTYFVRDNGVGFDMAYADKLFGVFQRLHSNEEFEGTGVGLAIVNRIVHRHGGRVWAEGEPGAGATFYFTLPSVKGDGNERRD
ncbi:MAG TPA: ATP-binding protein [Pyrinomonadaceae bacterium]|nr:ATP-binding protein [Pyrinomonadaceae bacterium]